MESGFMTQKDLHPNILRCIDTFEHEDGHCFVYELCDSNLEQRLIDMAKSANLDNPDDVLSDKINIIEKISAAV